MAALHVQCWREAYAAFLPPELMATFSTQSRLPMWQKSLGDETRIVVAAYDRQMPVAFAIAGFPEERFFDGEDGHIAALYVASSHYRMGIGRKLIALTAQRWLAQGGHSLALGVLAENVRARSFYEALGARLVKETTFEWDGFPLPDAIYEFEDLPALIP